VLTVAGIIAVGGLFFTPIGRLILFFSISVLMNPIVLFIITVLGLTILRSK